MGIRRLYKSGEKEVEEGMKKNNNDIYKIVIVGLIALLAINFGGDYVFRGGQIEINEIMGDTWTTQAVINIDQNKINILVTEVLLELDKDVRSNMKVVDQLIGIIMRNGEV